MNSLLKKYHKIPAPAKASLWFTVTQIFQKGVGFIVVPLYTRILTSYDYGRYTIFTSWYEVMLIFGTLRLYSNSFSVGLTKYGEDKDRFTSALLGFGWVCTLFFYFFAVLFHKLFEKWLEMPFYLISLLFLEIFWQPAFGLWSQRQRYAFKYKALNVVTAVSTVTTPLLGLLLIMLLHDQGLGAILGKCLPQIFAGVFCAFLILKKK